MKTAVVLFNLGGPDSPEAVRPFLKNLFSDPAIIGVPQPFRWLLSEVLSRRRAPVAREIYGKIGGRSPILPQTDDQARALDVWFERKGLQARSFIAMRYWKPFAAETAAAVKAYAPERVVLAPLYPQFSTTTSASSIADWEKAARVAGIAVETKTLCCFPLEDGFVRAYADLLRAELAQVPVGAKTRVLFSAHGLPERVIQRGDPYQFQVERTADAIARMLGEAMPDWRVTYQSKVGPLKWIGPATDEEIGRAGSEGTGLVIVPLAFVSEHSETLVELDIEYRELAHEKGVPFYRRAAAVGTHPDFIAGLGAAILRTIQATTICGGAPDGGRLCPAKFGQCPKADGGVAHV
jgi:protoporphyrin/coproporphyrin ferrochelatase